jgi:hypothetical protein
MDVKIHSICQESNRGHQVTDCVFTDSDCRLIGYNFKQLHETELRVKLIVYQMVKNFPAFIKPEVTLSYFFRMALQQGSGHGLLLEVSLILF